jgi:hypothetical protein
MIKCRLYVAIVGVADITALRVENHGNPRAEIVDGGKGLLQCGETGRPIALEKCHVGLVCGHEVAGGLNHCSVEGDNRVDGSTLLKVWGDELDVGIEPHA